MEKVLISSCLLGERVRYHGGHAIIEHPILERWAREDRLVPFCPEMAGGLGTPRPAAEITTTTDGRIVWTAAGRDVTAAFERGAQAAAEACAQKGIRIAILKDGSPSCGSHTIYDGTFTGRRMQGNGVTAGGLGEIGIVVFSEGEIDAAAEYITLLEQQ